MSTDYLAVVPAVPRSIEHGDSDLPAISVVAVPDDGPGPCSECAEGPAGSPRPIPPAVAVVRYHSSAIRGPVAEATCLVCLPDLVATLTGFGEGPLRVELYSPCPPAASGRPRTHRIARIDHERAELVRLLLTEDVGELTRGALQQCFAARTQDLARIAGAGVFATPVSGLRTGDEKGS